MNLIGLRISRLIYTNCFVLFLLTGCVHRIHVSPIPDTTTSHPFPFHVGVEVPFVALEGADHMPGIVLLEWTSEDLRDGIISYIEKRGTFDSVGREDSPLILTVKAWLTLRAPDHYVYHIHLESELAKRNEPPIGSYVASSQAKGSIVRWVTASDREPIQSATSQALDSLLAQIEADRSRLLNGHTR